MKKRAILISGKSLISSCGLILLLLSLFILASCTKTNVLSETTTESLRTSESPQSSKPIYLEKIQLSVSDITLHEKESIALDITTVPENSYNGSYFVVSDNSDIAVYKNGNITAVSVGETYIRVISYDRSVSAVCKVKVTRRDISSVRYNEDGLPSYTPVFDDSVEYYDFPGNKVKHIFCHCLVGYEQGQSENSTYYGECLTVNEFKALLNSLYDRNYVLIDIDYMFEYAYDGDGRMTAKVRDTIKLPKGKLPVILSVDNVAYPKYEHLRGRADGLTIIDGELYTFTNLEDGSVYYSDDNEVFPILEKFIAEHPDFSFSGAKCVVCPSAAENLFGYATYLGAENREENIEKAKEVAWWFADNGYSFACHSYYHKRFRDQTEEQIIKDFELYNAEATPIIGKTHIFINPHGTDPETDAKAKILFEAGYCVDCSTVLTGKHNNDYRIPGLAHTERITLCSSLLITYKNHQSYLDMFDPYEIYDNKIHITKFYKI